MTYGSKPAKWWCRAGTLTAWRAKDHPVLDDELLQAAAERAARTGRAQRDVIEEALRRFLGLETTVRRIQARGDLDEEESLALAYRKLDAYRAKRAKAM